jgi:hypothetical protein
MRAFKKVSAAVAATVAALASSPALAGGGNYPFVEKLNLLGLDISGPVAGIAIMVACVVIGVIIMMRGGGAAMAGGASFIVGAAVVAWAVSAPGFFGVAAGASMAGLF